MAPNNAPMRADPNQQNIAARNMVLNSAVNMWQTVHEKTYTGGAGEVLNIDVRNVGLIKRLVIELEATVARSASETQTRTAFGPANLLSGIVFTDLSNQTRVNTTGWHLHSLATARRQRAFGAAFTNDSPVDIGSNYNVIVSPSSFTTGNQTVRMFYEVPIAYNDFDLRGAVYANVVNATMNLQLTVNNNFFVGSAANPTLAGYQSSSSDLGTISSLNVKVHQNYLDQLPMTNNGPVLPILDLSTAYLLNNTAITGMSSGQDLAIPYANFRNFMSTFAMYDNEGLNAGSDINYWALQSANYTNIFKYGPFMSSLLTREIIGDDFPAGVYYFSHRQKPITTVQYGNMQLVMNPSSVSGSASQVLVGYEALALINQITQAGSLANT